MFSKEGYIIPEIKLKQYTSTPAQGEVVVTKNDTGQIVMVSRQDSEGNILSVIAESENT